MIFRQWYLGTHMFFGGVEAHGNVYGSDDWEDGRNVCIGTVEQMWNAEEEFYIVQTNYGRLYRLDAVERAEDKWEETCRFMEKIGVTGLCRADAEKMLEDKEKEEERRKRNEKMVADAEEWAEANLCPGELFAVVENLMIKKAYFKDGAGVLLEVIMNVHVGTFQDSVLLMTKSGGFLDFRYFPISGMEVYVWTDKIRKVYIYNYDNFEFAFKTERSSLAEKIITCKAGEVTCVERDFFYKEDWKQES